MNQNNKVSNEAVKNYYKTNMIKSPWTEIRNFESRYGISIHFTDKKNTFPKACSKRRRKQTTSRNVMASVRRLVQPISSESRRTDLLPSGDITTDQRRSFLHGGMWNPTSAAGTRKKLLRLRVFKEKKRKKFIKGSHPTWKIIGKYHGLRSGKREEEIGNEK